MTSLSSRLGGNQRFDFVSGAYDADTFSVVRMHGHEGLSRLYRFELILVSDNARIDFDRVLQQKATLRILAPDDTSRSTPYSGMLAEFDQLHHAGGYTFYRAVLVPRAWRLLQMRTTEVYLNEQTVPQIIESLLHDARLSGDDVDFKLTLSYRARSYVCQYQESHFDFISRWMEKEGMYYYFEQVGETDTLAIVDDRSMHASTAVAVHYRPADELDTGSAPDSVQGFVCQQRPLPNKVVLQDYNYRKASLPLRAEAVVSATGFGEAMFLGDNFRDAEEGQRYATLRAQELLCGGKVFAGEATAVGLRSGYFMRIANHYRDDFNGAYLVTEITHEGSQAGALLAGIKTPYGDQAGRGEETAYRNTFRAIPADVQFRAPRTTPKPRVAGTMSAMVDAEGSGQYADLDEFGQYKVQLPFDRTDKSVDKGSARIRMASPYSGDGHGMHFPLHKSAEVLLSFTDGDPDQPVIVGTVPNSTHASVVDASDPRQNRIATAGGNKVLIDDTDGAQSVSLYSPRDHTSIRLGATPGGAKSSHASSGYNALTMGGSNTLVIGQTNELAVGPYNFACATGQTTLTFPVYNSIVVGTYLNAIAGNNVNWTFGPTLALQSGDTANFADSNLMQASGSLKFGGGLTPAGLTAYGLTKPAFYSAKVLLAATALANLAAGGAIATLVTTGEGNANDIAYGEIPGAVVVNGASALTIGALTKYLASLYEKLPQVSKLELGQTGVTLGVDFLPASQGSLSMTEAFVSLSRTGVTPPMSAELTMGEIDAGLMFSSAGMSSALTADAKGATLSYFSDPEAPISSVAVGPAIVARCDTATLTMQPESFAAVVGGTELILTDDGMLASCGGTSLTMGDDLASLSASGNSVVVDAEGVNIVGELIQLG